MGSQIISRQLTSRLVTSNSDRVIAYVPMPPGTKLNNVWLDVSVLPTVQMGINEACLYGLSGFVVDVDDPDTAEAYDLVWDKMIHKDIAEAYNILSIDTNTADTGPEYEPGQLDLMQIFGDNLIGNMQIYQKREMLTYPKKPLGYDPSNDTYFASDAFKVHVRNGPTVRSPSIAMFGFSSPDITTPTTSTGDIGTTPTEREWLFTMYAEVFVYDMWKHLIGVTPSSSTNPYDAVSAWFAKLMEDALFQYESGDYTTRDYKVWTKATWDITVVGKPSKPVLTSD